MASRGVVWLAGGSPAGSCFQAVQLLVATALLLSGSLSQEGFLRPMLSLAFVQFFGWWYPVRSGGHQLLHFLYCQILRFLLHAGLMPYSPAGPQLARSPTSVSRPFSPRGHVNVIPALLCLSWQTFLETSALPSASLVSNGSVKQFFDSSLLHLASGSLPLHCLLPFWGSNSAVCT